MIKGCQNAEMMERRAERQRGRDSEMTKRGEQEEGEEGRNRSENIYGTQNLRVLNILSEQ